MAIRQTGTVFFKLAVYPGWAGDGSDGNVTISSGTTTSTRAMFYDTLTITGGLLNPAGYPIFCKTAYISSGAGQIARNGNSVLAGQSGGAALTANLLGGSGAGGDGGGALNNGFTGGSQSNSYGGSGGAGSDGTVGFGGVAGTATAPSVLSGSIRGGPLPLWGHILGAGAVARINGGAGGGGGGGGTIPFPGPGNGAGGGGGVVVVISPFINGVISAIGGEASDAVPFGGGVAGGGGGGVIVACYLEKGSSASFAVTGGFAAVNPGSDGTIFEPA